MTRRLVVSYLSVTIVILIILGIPLGIFFDQRETDRLTVNAERDATVLAGFYEEALEGGRDLDPTFAADYSARTGARVVIVDTGGISLVDTGAAIDRDFSTRPEIESALAGMRQSGTRRSDTLDTDLLFVAVPVASGGVVSGAVRVSLDTHEVSERVTKFWWGLAAIAAVVLIAMAGVGWVIARSMTRPVRRLRLTASRFAGGDLEQTVPDERAPAELVDLERTMNTMAQRLEALLEQQREFVADASHQLRTPLTGLRLRLENLQSELDDEGQAQEIGVAIEETDRLAEIVRDLLQLARARRVMEPVTVDLGAMVREHVDTWSALADAADVRLQVTAPETGVEIVMAPGAIEQILDNLLDNAVKYSPKGSTVRIEAREGGEARGGLTARELRVVDEGPGMSDAQKLDATQRFWRGDASVPGSGLGLSIVHALVEASGGALSFGDNHPSGLIVEIRLPAPDQPDALRRRVAAPPPHAS